MLSASHQGSCEAQECRGDRVASRGDCDSPAAAGSMAQLLVSYTEQGCPCVPGSPLPFPGGSCSPVLELFPLLSLTPTLGAQRSGAGGFSLLANDAPSQLHSFKAHSAGPGASDL